ncbi:MAG TPA: serine hydrolase domain-containing protein [Candidatus Nanopelagicales bacterium]|nr:serine hydrolase domain-containing protein [Candidatus Nanopelagicales bacterium]
MAPERPRRRRRLMLLAGLAAVFTFAVMAGWAVADPNAFTAAIGGIAHGIDRTAGPPGAGAPVATVAPGSTSTAAPDRTADPAPTAPPTPAPATPPPAPAVPKAMAARLDRALASAQKALILPGVQATVIFADGSTWTGVRGLADVTAGQPVRAETPFAAASVTKTFTAALVLRYVDQGLIGLDDPLARWLPDWPNAKKITIRMLLNHTSGIPDYFRNPAFDLALNKDKKRTWTSAEVLAQFVRPGAVFPPGKGWSYSNTNYLLLGAVAATVGGAPWEELVRRELVEPLGLDATYVQAVDEPATPPARAYRIIAGFRGPTPEARTDGSDVVPFRSVITAAGSAGAIASTTTDLARWARALYGGSAVLSLATRREMFTFVKAYAYGLGTSYGLGVSRVKFDGHAAYGHTGALVGTRAAIRYFPKEKVTVAVLFNRETFVGDDVVRILARTLFPKPAATPSPSPGTSPLPTAAP